MSLKAVTKIFYSLVGVLFFLCTNAQETPGLVLDQSLKNQTYTFTLTSFHSNNSPKFIIQPTNADQFGVTDLDNGNNEYEISYTPTNDFLGTSKFTIEYYKDGPVGQWPLAYINFEIEVVTSKIIASDDFHIFDSINSTEAIDVLANDTTTADTLFISKIVQSSGGSTTINTDGLIEFTPDVVNNFTGHVEYIVEDETGSFDLGSLTIISDDQGGTDSLYFTITNERAFNVILPGVNCSISEYPSFGEAEIVSSSNALVYTPDSSAEGSDELLVVDGSDQLLITFEVIDLANTDGYAKDDYVFTPWNETVSFDVFANDYEADSNVIVDYSVELVFDSLGQFSYTPSQWYLGVQEFFYTSYNGFEHQTAKIIMSVDNQVPNSLGNYVINGIENESIVLNYAVPIEGYSFTELNAPLHGSLTIESGDVSVDLDCDTISGHDLIVYQPDLDYTGTDEFALRYRIDGQNISVVKFTIDLQEDSNNTLCHCVGLDCVWPGDANNDGRVFIDDLLAVGMNMGEVGELRDTDINYNHWFGQKAQDWGTQLGEIGDDLKHIDSDGDGYITADDIIDIEENFDSAHGLFTNKILGTKDFGVFLEPSHMPVDSGDLLCVTIKIGNEDNPVIDMHGLSFDLNINEDVIDSSSLTFEFFENDWFTYNSSQIDMHIQPTDGVIYAGLSRSDGNVTSGHGPVGKACFIVEEDLGGFKGDGQLAAFTIATSQITTMDADGNYFQLPNTEIEIPFNTEVKKDIDQNSLIIYPNPTSDILNIHLNGSQNINDIQIINFNGQLISRYNNLDTDHYSLDVSTLNTGLYVAKVRSQDKWIYKKFKVLN